MSANIASGGNVVPFRRAEPCDPTFAIYLIDICGNRIGSHLTEFGDVALFVEHLGEPVGGVLLLADAIALRDGLTTMIAAAIAGGGPEAA